jgi:hypothetical protein
MSRAKYPRLDLGTIEAIVNKLGGMNGVARFLNNETRVVPTVPNQWPIWGTVELGTGFKTGDDFIKSLGDANLSRRAEIIMCMPDFQESIANEKTRINLVSVSVLELGFKHSASYVEICGRAIERGLSLCPAEVGPQLCLQHKGSRETKWSRVIAMEAITDITNKPWVLYVQKGDGGVTFLSYNDGGDQKIYGTDEEFLFQCP